MSDINTIERSVPGKSWPLLAVLAVIAAMYHFCGVSVYREINGNSLYIWLYYAWTNSSADGLDSSYSFVIPFVSLYAVYLRWDSIRACSCDVFRPGLAAILASMAIHWLGMKAQIPHLSVLSMICLLYSSVLFLYGRKMAAELAFPAAYLLFCIPMSFLDSVTFPLRLFAAKSAALLLNGIGIEAMADGTAMVLAGYEDMVLDVAAPCSGMRSLFVIMALSAAYAYLFCSGSRVRWSIVFLSVPLAVLLNVLRITSIAVVAVSSSRAAAMHYFHNISGYVSIVAALLVLFGIRSWLYRVFKTGDGNG